MNPAPPGNVDRLDAAFDAMLDSIRGHAFPDRVFYTASRLGDWSLIWHLINSAGLATGWRSGNQFVRLAAFIAAESLLVNQGIKRLFRRARPTFAGDHPHHVRRPSTSSFPSGHATAATVAAMLLSADHTRWWSVWVLIALVVTISRPYVRVHHASDIVGGVVVGAVLGSAFLLIR